MNRQRYRVSDLDLELDSGRQSRIVSGITVPNVPAGETCPLVLMVHGYMGNKNESGYFYGGKGNQPGAAQQLCDLGIASARLDFPGCGESQESFRGFTIDNMLQDLETLYKFVLSHVPVDISRVGLLCWSNGGRIGSLFMERHPEIRTAVLWAPVADNGDWMWPHIAASLNPLFPSCNPKEEQDYYNQMWRIAEEKGYAEIPWYNDISRMTPIDLAFYVGNKAARPLDVLKEVHGNILMLVPGADQNVPPDVYRHIVENTDINWVELPGVGHDLGSETGDNRTFKTVLDITVSYLFRYLAG